MTLDEYQRKSLATVKDTANNIPYAALGLASEAGEVTEKVKKWIRDDNSDPAKLDKETLAGELGDALWYIAIMSDMLDMSLGEVAQKNIAKLTDRYQRGKIGGSGDNR